MHDLVVGDDDAHRGDDPLAGSDQRLVGGTAGAEATAELRHDLIHHALGHDPVSGELAARDREQPIGLLDHLVAARDLRGLLALLVDERPHAGPGAGHVGMAHAGMGQDPVGRFEQVVDVLPGDRRALDRFGIVGIGGADPDDRVVRHDEHRTTVDRAHDEDVVDRHARARHDQVDAFGQVHPRPHLAPEATDRVHPGPGGVHDGTAGDREAAAVGLVADLDPHAPAGDRLDPHGRSVAREVRAVALRRLERLEGESGVVGHVLGEDGRSLQLVRLDARDTPHGLVPVPDLVVLVVVELHELLVGPEAGAQLEQARARPAVDRHDHVGADREVRHQAAQGGAFDRSLAHESDLALLEVAHAAVDQFRGAARRARGEVAALDEPGPQAAHRGVAHDARAGDAAAHDEQVEAVALHRLEVGSPGLV